LKTKYKNMKKILVLFVNLAFISQLSFSQSFNSWRGPNRDGHYPDVNLLKSWPANGPKMVWAYENLGLGFSSPVVVDDKIYVTGLEGENGFVYVLSDMGVFQRKFLYGKDFSSSYPGARSTPVIAGNLLYMATGHGELVCVNIITGQRIWSKDLFRDFDGSNLRWGFTENMVLDGDVIYVSPGGKRHNIVALNRNTGDVIWSSPAKGTLSSYGSPLLINHGGKKILVGHMTDHVVGINAANGNMLWSYPFTNRWSVHPNTPIFHNGELYVLSGYGTGGVKLRLSADGTSVSSAWENDWLDPKTGGAVLLDGFVYGSGDRNRRWFGVNWSTGEVVSESRDIDTGTVIAADGMLYAYTERGELALLKPDRGNLSVAGQTRIELGSDQHWAHLVINNGILYVRRGNALMAYNIRNQ
jgi:outer membrane protein assembly factor BamB